MLLRASRTAICGNSTGVRSVKQLYAELVTDRDKEIGVRLLDVQWQLANHMRSVNKGPYAHTASDSGHLFPWKDKTWAA